MTTSLVVLLNGADMGSVDRDRHGRLTFTYRDAWRNLKGSMPLSLSMPLAAAQHAHDPITAFMWGLLPDNVQTLERWGQRFHVSARNPFGLLTHVGEDCAGAVQFVTPERLESMQAEPTASEVTWLDEADVAKRLQRLRDDRTAWRLPQDRGQFSLAGAQPKTALLYLEGRWGLPCGRMATTHILKPPNADLDGLIENEFFCLTLARHMNLPAAGSEIRHFKDEVALVIERFDRSPTAALAAAAAAEAAATAASLAAGGDISAARRVADAAARAAFLAELSRTQPVLRLHQEDLCQALGLHPMYKYENEGGPGAQDVVTLLRTHSSSASIDVDTFVAALAFNWLIAGTDAHAKNYAILHGGGGRIRLAPLYDLVSALPYDDMDPMRIKLAMKVGGKYRLRDIGLHQWEKQAQALHLDPATLLHRIASQALAMQEVIPRVRDHALQQGLSRDTMVRLAERLLRRSERCHQAMTH